MKPASKERFSNKGFVMPLVLAIGLTLVLAAVTLIKITQVDRSSTSAQNQTTQSLAIVEGGISRTLFILNQASNNLLLQFSYDLINPKTNHTYLGPDGIQNSGDEEQTAVDQWSNASPCLSTSNIAAILQGTIGSGTYTVKAYRYNSNTQIGTLLVEGQVGSSISRIQTKLPIITNIKIGSFAGLYASQFISIGNNDVIGGTDTSSNTNLGNIICINCPGSGANYCTNPLSSANQQAARTAIGAKSNATITGNIYLGPASLPPLLTVPKDTSGNIQNYVNNF